MPSFASEAEIDLSVVIPAYNEIDRLPGMLDECVECLKTAKKQTWVTGLFIGNTVLLLSRLRLVYGLYEVHFHLKTLKCNPVKNYCKVSIKHL